MRIALLASLLLGSATTYGADLDQRIGWSPDGAWIAYTARVRPEAVASEPGWLFGTSGVAAPPTDPAAPDFENRDQLWVTRVDGRLSHLVDESPDLILGPSWSPDGRAVAFGRRGDDPEVIEVVIWEGPARSRLVGTRPFPGTREEVERIAGESIAWSPDGRYVAVPQGPTLGLAILHVEEGRQVNLIPGGSLPSWSPTGPQLACFIPSESGQSLAVLDSALGRAKPLCEVGKATSPALWTREGLVTAVFGARQNQIRFDRPMRPVDLVRVRTDNGQIETIRALAAETSIPVGREIEGLSFSIDREGDDLFWSMSVGARAHHIEWYRPREVLVRNRMVILDPALPIRSIALSPKGGRLAARFARDEFLSPPILLSYDGRDQDLRAIVPDDFARASWVTLMIDAARKALASRPARAQAGDSPTILPYPGELGPVGDVPQRIRRVSLMGRSLCDRPSDLPDADPRLGALLGEARLFFDVLSEDYAAARADLDRGEPSADAPERRLALLGLRAQIALGLGEFDRAGRMINYLRSIEPKPASRLEWVGLRAVLTADPRPGPGWVATLAERATRLRDLAAAQARGEPDAAAASHDRFTPDPIQGLGFDAIRPGVLNGRFGNIEEPVLPPPRNRFPAPPDRPADPPVRGRRVFPPPDPLP
ncbi:TolB family protein [Tundrisphaera sp. TA3]|uniref:TolB family protein n=1 Tax=Tundrisphaera sp. TA3 TaxID=3435775 RepID=UPI003EBC978D